MNSHPAAYGSSLRKSIELLGAFQVGDELRASEIGRKLGIDRSTASRLAHALVRHRFLAQDLSNKRYRLGMRLWELGVLAVTDEGLWMVTRPRMYELVAETGFPSQLAILDRGDVIYLERIESNTKHPWLRIGLRVPAYAVATGKVLLAYLSRSERRNRCVHFTPFTARTLGNSVALDDQCRLVRRRGYAVNREELEPGFGGLAAPIFNSDGTCVAALGIGAPVTRLNGTAARKLIVSVVRAAASVTAALGEGELGQSTSTSRAAMSSIAIRSAVKGTG
jgi:IclR family KDG regulon transcriptional repressor